MIASRLAVIKANIGSNNNNAPKPPPGGKVSSYLATFRGALVAIVEFRTLPSVAWERIFGIAQLVFYANGVVHLGGTALFKCYAHSKRRRSLWEPNHFANALPSATYDHLF